MSDLLERNLLVIDQKPKLIELTNEYLIRDEAGDEVGVIREEGQSKAKKVFRFFSDVDQFLTHRLAVYDRDGTKVLEMVRPAKILKSTLRVSDDQGRPAGQIVQENVMGRKRFRLEGPGGEVLGSINAENLASWDFAIQDSDGNEVGRITKNWAGILTEAFTTADRYLLNISRTVSPELRLLMVASAAGVDTALKQDDRGGIGVGGFDI
jgi:uncharacterized protein YxjI